MSTITATELAACSAEVTVDLTTAEPVEVAVDLPPFPQVVPVELCPPEA